MGTRHRLLWGRAGGSSTPQHTLPLLAPAPSLLKQAKDPRFLPGSWKTGVMLLGQVCKKSGCALKLQCQDAPWHCPSPQSLLAEACWIYYSIQGTNLIFLLIALQQSDWTYSPGQGQGQLFVWQTQLDGSSERQFGNCISRPHLALPRATCACSMCCKRAFCRQAWLVRGAQLLPKPKLGDLEDFGGSKHPAVVAVVH